jgi:dethiobiotin synthetase
MSKTIFVTATNTDVGKSYASEILLKKYASQNLKVGYFKPIETGVSKDTEGYPLDGYKLLNIAKKLNADFKVDICDVVPYQFELPASPYVAKCSTQIDIDFIKDRLNYLQSFCDVLIVEGAGGLLVPVEKDIFMIDLIKLLDIDEVVLISPSHLGSINDTLLSQEALKSRNIKFKWYINLYKDADEFAKVTLPFYKDCFTKIDYLEDLIDAK